MTTADCLHVEQIKSSLLGVRFLAILSFFNVVKKSQQPLKEYRSHSFYAGIGYLHLTSLPKM